MAAHSHDHSLDRERSSMLDGLVDRMMGLREVVSAAESPLPVQTGDATPLPRPERHGIRETISNLLKTVAHSTPENMETLVKMIKISLLNEDMDDRQYTMENLIKTAIDASGNPLGDKITDLFVTQLWNDLDHPPQMYMSDEYQYRQADGANNSFLHPRLGAAHTPYARTVQPKASQPGVRPDPGVLFDCLMARDKPTEHPNRISSVLFYLASIIIHDIFRTNHQDYNISDTSSYLDLAPLYGSDWNEQKDMRTFEDGKIKPDCFSESRLLNFPPGVGALLIMFNRFHNHTVEQLALINENRRFDKPDRSDEKKYSKYDNDLFQTGRLITCGLYVNIILIDYVRTILNLNKTDDNWQLNPRADIANGPEMATGNQCSAEFNLVYRWHAAISDRDDDWSRNLFAELFGGRTPEEIPQKEFLLKLCEVERRLMGTKPDKRPFAKLERQADGLFNDDDLVKIMVESVEDCANAFGPRQVPTVMKAVEILGIQQARSWNCASLNEFRKHFKLKPHATFESITENKEVAACLERLYGTPDNVELYPGLVVEDAKIPKDPGSGLCPSYTVSRGVLSDATALVRGDRFYTLSYNPRMLTNWGFAETEFDLNVTNGCCMYKLFLRAFPNHFRSDSLYIHYPFTVPDEMKLAFDGPGMGAKVHMYDLDRPVISGLKEPRAITSRSAVHQVLEDPLQYSEALLPTISFLKGRKVGRETEVRVSSAIHDMLATDVEPGMYGKLVDECQPFFIKQAGCYLQNPTYRLVRMHEVDVVRDIVHHIPTRLVAELFSIPLKTKENPLGIITESGLRDVLFAIASLGTFDPDLVKSHQMRLSQVKVLSELRGVMEVELSLMKIKGKFSKDYAKKLHEPHSSDLRTFGHQIIQDLFRKDLNSFEVFAAIMTIASDLTTSIGSISATSIEYLIKNPDRLAELRELSASEASRTDLRHFVQELARMTSQTAAYRTVTSKPTLKDGDRTLDLNPGDLLALNIKAANHDPAVFESPDTFNATRDLATYLPLAPNLYSPSSSLWEDVILSSITGTLLSLAHLPNLRSAKVWMNNKMLDDPTANNDRIRKIPVPFLATKNPNEEDLQTDQMVYDAYLTENWDALSAFPRSLKINWDDAEAPVTNGKGKEKEGVKEKEAEDGLPNEKASTNGHA